MIRVGGGSGLRGRRSGRDRFGRVGGGRGIGCVWRVGPGCAMVC